MPTIQTLIERERGCGFRKPGATYLIGGTSSSPCCKLPFAISECSCCGNRIKQTRGLQWINARLFGRSDCSNGTLFKQYCPLMMDQLKIGLMWVGEMFYPTPGDFSREASAIGVSKRIGTIPKECKPGTWIALAHPKAISSVSYEGPGIFMLFKVTSIDYVVKGNESEEELTSLEAEGFRLVKIEREGEQRNFVFDPNDAAYE